MILFFIISDFSLQGLAVGVACPLTSLLSRRIFYLLLFLVEKKNLSGLCTANKCMSASSRSDGSRKDLLLKFAPQFSIIKVN